MPDISATLKGFQVMAEQFVPLLVQSVAVAGGLILIFLAIRKLFSKGQSGQSQQEAGWGAIAGQLLIGGLMLRFGASMTDLSEMLFGSQIQDIRGVMAYAPLGAKAGFWKQVMEVCLLWVVMLGWAGAFKGLMLWNQAVSGGNSGGQGGDLYWRGFWHLIGGAAAVNLTGALQAFFGK